METFKLKVDDREFTIRPLEEVDQILYEVYDNDLVCVIGLNENAEWEANNNYSEDMVKKIGGAINQHEQ